ncbi:MAG TPA: M23 family metallopeptidase [Clostridia bacterium]|nr:M23 family metallopeptidase [Clostridia bacterium]
MDWNGFDKATAFDSENTAETKMSKKSIIYKFGSVIAVIAVIFFIAKLQTPLTEELSRQLKSVMSLDIDVNDSLGKAKFIKNIVPGHIEVSNTDSADAYSKVLLDFSKTEHNGAIYDFSEDDPIKALSDGIIIRNTGRILEIIQKDGTHIVYEGCKEAPLSVGTRVKRNDLIAVCDSGGLWLRVYCSSVQIDPVSYINGLRNKK